MCIRDRRYGSRVSTDCQGPDTTRPRGGRIPQSRTTSTGVPAEAPCGGTRPTSYTASPFCPPPMACTICIQACGRPVSTATRAPVAAVRSAST